MHDLKNKQSNEDVPTNINEKAPNSIDEKDSFGINEETAEKHPIKVYKECN